MSDRIGDIPSAESSLLSCSTFPSVYQKRNESEVEVEKSDFVELVEVWTSLERKVLFLFFLFCGACQKFGRTNVCRDAMRREHGALAPARDFFLPVPRNDRISYP